MSAVDTHKVALHLFRLGFSRVSNQFNNIPFLTDLDEKQDPVRRIVAPTATEIAAPLESNSLTPNVLFRKTQFLICVSTVSVANVKAASTVPAKNVSRTAIRFKKEA